MKIMLENNDRIIRYGKYTRELPNALYPYNHSWQLNIGDMIITLYTADGSFRLSYVDGNGDLYYDFSSEDNCVTYYGESHSVFPSVEEGHFKDFQDHLENMLSVYDEAENYINTLVAAIVDKVDRSESFILVNAEGISNLPKTLRDVKHLVYVIEHNQCYRDFSDKQWQNEGKSIFLTIESNCLILNRMDGTLVGETLYQPPKRIRDCINNLDIEKEIDTLSSLYNIIPFNRTEIEVFSIALNLKNCEIVYTDKQIPSSGYLCLYSEEAEPSCMTENLSSRERIDRYEMREVYLKQSVIPKWDRQSLFLEVENIIGQGDES